MRVDAFLDILARASRWTAHDVVAVLRGGALRPRVALSLAVLLPLCVRARPGSEDESFVHLTALVVPACAFLWGRTWASVSEPRLRLLRAVLPEAPRLGRAIVAGQTLALASMTFGLTGAAVAARTGTPFTDVLATGRVAFASAFAFAGLGVASEPIRGLAILLVPVILAHFRAMRGFASAFVPTTHAHALTIDPPSGLEARVRFAALLAFGALGIARFALMPAGRTRADAGPGRAAIPGRGAGAA